jgi:HEPN domain-containing protein
MTPPYSHSLERLVQLLREQGVNTQALEGLQLKALTRMNTESRYPQDDEAPADLFDGRDSELALTTASAVVQSAAAHLAG